MPGLVTLLHLTKRIPEDWTASREGAFGQNDRMSGLRTKLIALNTALTV
jgi:hypothetical protein